VRPKVGKAAGAKAAAEDSRAAAQTERIFAMDFRGEVAKMLRHILP